MNTSSLLEILQGASAVFRGKFKLVSRQGCCSQGTRSCLRVGPSKEASPTTCPPSEPGAAGGSGSCLPLRLRLIPSSSCHSSSPGSCGPGTGSHSGSPDVLCSQCLRRRDDLSQRLSGTYARRFKCITCLILRQACEAGAVIAPVKYNQGRVT